MDSEDDIIEVAGGEPQVLEPVAPDGTPVGAVSVRLDLNSPTVIDDQTPDTGSEKAVLATLERLTGESGLVQYDKFYPGYNDSSRRVKAATAILAFDKTIEEAAEIAGVSARTVEMWAYNGDWASLKKCGAQVRRDLEKVTMSNLRISKRVPAMRDQFNSADKLREKGLSLLDEASTPRENEVAAGMIKTAADIMTRAIGIGESGSVGKDDDPMKGDGKDSGEGKKTLVVQFNNGVLPPVR